MMYNCNVSTLWYFHAFWRICFIIYNYLQNNSILWPVEELNQSSTSRRLGCRAFATDFGGRKQFVRKSSTRPMVHRTVSLFRHSQKLDTSIMICFIYRRDLSFADQMKIATDLLVGLEDNAFLLANVVTSEKVLRKSVKNICKPHRIPSDFLPRWSNRITYLLLFSFPVTSIYAIEANNVREINFPSEGSDHWGRMGDVLTMPAEALRENSDGGEWSSEWGDNFVFSTTCGQWKEGSLNYY